MTPKLLCGWKEIAAHLGGYHPDYVRKLFRGVRERLVLQYWFGKKRRIKMTQEEVEKFKEMVREK